MQASERIFTINGAASCVEVQGGADDPTVLLVGSSMVMIDGDDGVCRVHHRVPAGNNTILAGKNEQSWPRVPIFCHREERRAVKDDPGGSASIVVVFCRNRNDQRQRCTILMIECRDTGAVIADPNHGTVRIRRHAPWINKVWIGVLRDAGDVLLRRR